MQENRASDFNINKFISTLTRQAQNLFPDDIGDKTQAFIEKEIDKLLHLANDALDNDTEKKFKNDDKKWILQVLAELTFHKSIDLDRSKIPFEYWKSILQKIAFAIFEVSTQGLKRNLELDDILMAVEYHVNQVYKSSLQELFENRAITKEVLENAQKESNLDKMAAERNDGSNLSKNEQPKVELSSQISDMWEICKSKVSYFIIAGAAIIVLVCVLCFGESIWTALEPHKSLIIQIVTGIILLALIAGAVIYFTTQKEIKEQLKELDNLKQEMQDLANTDKQHERLSTDVLLLEISAELMPIADLDQEGMLLPNITALRQELTDKLGYIMPGIRIIDNSELDAYEYRISVRGQKVSSGYVYPGRYMVNADEWDSVVGKASEATITRINPLKGVQCYWVKEEDINKYPNITALDPEAIIKKHLRQLVIMHVDSILSSSDIEKYFESAEKMGASQNITDKLKERLELGDIRQVFANLIREEVSIKDIVFVLDRLCDYSRTTQNPHELSEMLRKILPDKSI